jgi:hypothetical protein
MIMRCSHLLLVSTFFAVEGKMGELNRAERLQIMLPPAELRLVDNGRFKRRMPSRASAVRELLKRGLLADGFDEAEEGARSKDFGLNKLAAE